MHRRARVQTALAFLVCVSSGAFAQSANFAIPSVQSEMRAPADLRDVRISFRTEEHVRELGTLHHRIVPLAPERVPAGTVDFGLYVMWSEMPHRRALLNLPGDLPVADFAKSFELTLMIRPLEDERLISCPSYGNCTSPRLN